MIHVRRVAAVAVAALAAALVQPVAAHAAAPPAPPSDARLAAEHAGARLVVLDIDGVHRKFEVARYGDDRIHVN
ncbi:hypothetical protein ABZ372_42440, partial [Streptomyces sp. NPDC005921]